MTDERPNVLFVYYTFTKQTGMVVDAMAEELTARGCNVTKAALEFPDAHYGGRFSKLPMPWPILHIVGMLPAQKGRKTGEITIPPEAQHGGYDLVVFGSPTWWLTTACRCARTCNRPPRRPSSTASRSRPYRSRAATTRATLATSRSWASRPAEPGPAARTSSSDGNQVMSMASWLVFMRKNEPRRRYFGVPMPRPNLKANFAEQAKATQISWQTRSSAPQPLTPRG